MSFFGRARKFGSGVVASLAGASVVYLVADSANDIITLRKCQHQVLDLAVKHSGLCQELGVPIEVGSLLKSSVRFSPSGRLVKCQFAVDGATKSSDVSATLHRPVYPSSILYNLSGPGDWELLNCHILVGGSDTLVRSVNLLTNEQEGPRSPPKPLPAHLFKEMQRFHAQAPPDAAPSGPDATPPPDSREQ